MRTLVRATLSRWTTPLWPATLLGILLGAAIGAAALSFTEGGSQATALIRVDQPIDPNQIMTGTAPSTDSQQNYLAGEIIFLTSPGFADAVGRELNETTPHAVSAVQTGNSSVITLSTTADNFTEAQRIVNAAIKAYGDHVAQQNRDRGQAAVDALNGVIGGLEAQQNESQEQQSTYGTETQYDENGLPITPVDPTTQQARIDELIAQRLSIEVQINRAPGIQIVQAPTEPSAVGSPNWTLGAVGGGLLGGLVSLATALALRKRLGSITSPSALEGESAHLLLPAVRLRNSAPDPEEREPDAAVARALYAQLPAPRSGRILLVGASAISGTTEIARLIAFAAAEHERVTVVNLLDGFQLPDSEDSFGRFATLGEVYGADRQRAETTTVIIGGSLDNSPALPEAAANASQIIIVAMVGRDAKHSVRIAGQLTRDRDIPVSVVCTRRKVWNASTRSVAKPAKQSRHAAGRHYAGASTAISEPIPTVEPQRAATPAPEPDLEPDQTTTAAADLDLDVSADQTTTATADSDQGWDWDLDSATTPDSEPTQNNSDEWDDAGAIASTDT